MATYNTLESSESDLVIGRWRDGIFSCCFNGSCLSLFCSAFGPWCWPCLISKIASRVNWDPRLPACLGGWRGRTPHQQWLRSLTILCIVYFTCMLGYNSIPPNQINEDELDKILDNERIIEIRTSTGRSLWEATLAGLFSTVMSLVMLTFSVIICLLRFQVRRAFRIPATCDAEGPWEPTLCGRAEDCACCYCCSCCTLAQMARHTRAVEESRCETCGDALDDPGPLPITPASMHNNSIA